MKWRAILLMLVLLLCLSACAAPDGSPKEEQAKKTEWQSAQRMQSRASLYVSEKS